MAKILTYLHLLLLLVLLINRVNGDPSPAPDPKLKYPPDHLVPPPPPTYSNLNNLSFMQRVARWFGFGTANDNSVQYEHQSEPTTIVQQRYNNAIQPIASSYLPQTVQYPAKQRTKAGCNPCNKVPWVPLHLGPSQKVGKYQYTYQQPPPQVIYHRPNPIRQQLGSDQQQHVLLPTYSSLNVQPTQQYIGSGITSPEYQPPKQLLPVQQPQHHLIPIPIPNLSVTPIPPLYESKPFRVESFVHPDRQQNVDSLPNLSNQIIYQHQLLPMLPNPYGPIPYQLAHDSLSAGTAIGESTPDIEIIKSVPLAEFVSSIQYPINIIQSPVIDLSSVQDKAGKHPDDMEAVSEYTSEPIIVPDEENVTILDNSPAATSHNISIRPDSKENIVAAPIQLNDSNKPLEAVDWSKKESIELNRIEKSTEKPTRLKKDRETPLHLLDSPIYYLGRTSTRDPSELRATNRPKVTHHHTTLTGYISSTESTVSPSTKFGYREYVDQSGRTGFIPTAQPFTHNSNINNIEVNGKKPKQIQLIIPYTTGNHPTPFRLPNNRTDPIDYHESQESKLVASVTVGPPSHLTTKYITKILATNLRELLKREKYPEKLTSFDIDRLQKNIDGWTEQEFSSLPHRASTISLSSQPKHIPTEYLPTTTPSVYNKDVTTTTTIGTTIYERLLSEEEFRKYDYSDESIDDNQIVPVPEAYRSNRSDNLWDSLKISISPQTNEKVYVVTPQPWTGYSMDSSAFISPRFLIRPTPGPLTTGQDVSITSKKLPERVNELAHQTTSTKSTKKYTPELFGLLGTSTFSGSIPVETIDGHSKVITVVTPPTLIKRKSNRDQIN